MHFHCDQFWDIPFKIQRFHNQQVMPLSVNRQKINFPIFILGLINQIRQSRTLDLSLYVTTALGSKFVVHR